MSVRFGNILKLVSLESDQLFEELSNSNDEFLKRARSMLSRPTSLTADQQLLLLNLGVDIVDEQQRVISFIDGILTTRSE